MYTIHCCWMRNVCSYWFRANFFLKNFFFWKYIYNLFSLSFPFLSYYHRLGWLDVTEIFDCCSLQLFYCYKIVDFPYDIINQSCRQSTERVINTLHNMTSFALLWFSVKLFRIHWNQFRLVQSDWKSDLKTELKAPRTPILGAFLAFRLEDINKNRTCEQRTSSGLV